MRGYSGAIGSFTFTIMSACSPDVIRGVDDRGSGALIKRILEAGSFTSTLLNDNFVSSVCAAHERRRELIQLYIRYL